jgi:hypothetical protein
VTDESKKADIHEPGHNLQLEHEDPIVRVLHKVANRPIEDEIIDVLHSRN